MDIMIITLCFWWRTEVWWRCSCPWMLLCSWYQPLWTIESSKGSRPFCRTQCICSYQALSPWSCSPSCNPRWSFSRALCNPHSTSYRTLWMRLSCIKSTSLLQKCLGRCCMVATLSWVWIWTRSDCSGDDGGGWWIFQWWSWRMFRDSW